MFTFDISMETSQKYYSFEQLIITHRDGQHRDLTHSISKFASRQRVMIYYQVHFFEIQADIFMSLESI